MLLDILASLAVYRISRMLGREDGPFDAFSYVRGFVAWNAPDGHWRSRGARCPACWSFYVGPIAAIALGQPIWHGLAYSGVATFLWMIEPGE